MPLITHQPKYTLLHQEHGRQHKSWNVTLAYDDGHQIKAHKIQE